MNGIAPVLVNKNDSRAVKVFSLLEAYTDRINRAVLRSNLNKFKLYDVVNRYTLKIFQLGTNIKIVYPRVIRGGY